MYQAKQKTGRKAPKQFINKSPIEALESVVGGFKDSVVNDLGKGVVTGVRESVAKDLGKGGITEAWDELLKTDIKSGEPQAGQGELSEGTEIDLGQLQKKTVEITEIGREFASEIVNAGRRKEAQNTQEVEVKMHEILIEIKKLSESSGELKEQVEIITLEQTSETPGVYHVSFLEKMLSNLRDLRANVDDSLAWFSALRSKKSARGYSNMAKKHGTSFTLSNERQVSTQVG
jgi:hypothetical protein